MRRYWKLSGLAFAALLVCGGLVTSCVFAYQIVDRRFCGEERGPELVSPDGQFAVQIVERNCGATTPFRTRIILKDRSLPWIMPYWFREEKIVEYTSTSEAVETVWTEPRYPLTKTPTLLSFRRCQCSEQD